MLGPWLPHQMYQQQLILKLIPHWFFDKGRILQMKNSILKLFHLDLDRILHIIKPLYSNTGAPSKEQAGIIRSLVLIKVNTVYLNGQKKWQMIHYFILSVGLLIRLRLHHPIMILLTVFGLVPRMQRSCGKRKYETFNQNPE
mgnify:CR=1 FL=1